MYVSKRRIIKKIFWKEKLAFRLISPSNHSFFYLRLKRWTLREGEVFSGFTSLTGFEERERERSITTLCLMASISQVFVATCVVCDFKVWNSSKLDLSKKKNPKWIQKVCKKMKQNKFNQVECWISAYCRLNSLL